MPHPNHEIARAFFAALSAGALPDALLTDDMTAWTTTSGVRNDRSRYQAGVAMLAAIADGGLAYTVESLTAEDDRVAAEVHAAGRLADGEPFANRYMFMLRIRDGRIAAVAEHFDPTPVVARIVPLLRARMGG